MRGPMGTEVSRIPRVIFCPQVNYVRKEGSEVGGRDGGSQVGCLDCAGSRHVQQRTPPFRFQSPRGGVRVFEGLASGWGTGARLSNPPPPAETRNATS